MDDSNGESSLLDEFKPSYILIVLDTHESMFIKDKNGDTPFSIALKACYSLVDSLLLAQKEREYHQFAIVITEEDSKASFLDFESNIIDSIKMLKEKIKLSQDELKATYMRKGIFNLASFLLFCKNKFISTSSTFYHRTIIFITQDPDPVCGDSENRLAVINEAKTFKTNGIKFQMATMEHNFKYEVFYNDLFSATDDEVVKEHLEDAKGLFEKLSSIIATRFTEQKVNFYPNKNDKTRYIPVVKKDIIKTQRLLNNARGSKDGKLLKKCIKEGNQPNRFSLKTHGDIVFSSEDQKEVRRSDFSVGLTLLYVSKRLTELGAIVQRSDLIEFNESSKEHADVCRNIFNKFWQYCHERERVLVCACRMSSNDHLRFVELVPKFAFNRKVFLMVYIPYQSERMQIPPEEDEGFIALKGKRKKVMQALVDRLTFDYDPKSFPNPCYAKKQAYVKSKLLDEPMEEVSDTTESTEDTDKRIEDVVGDFKKTFNLETKETNTKKRKRPAGRGRGRKK